MGEVGNNWNEKKSRDEQEQKVALTSRAGGPKEGGVSSQGRRGLESHSEAEETLQQVRMGETVWLPPFRASVFCLYFLVVKSTKSQREREPGRRRSCDAEQGRAEREQRPTGR